MFWTMTGLGILFFAGFVVYRVLRIFSDRMIEKSSKQCTGVVSDAGERDSHEDYWITSLRLDRIQPFDPWKDD